MATRCLTTVRQLRFRFDRKIVKDRLLDHLLELCLSLAKLVTAIRKLQLSRTFCHSKQLVWTLTNERVWVLYLSKV